MKRNQKYAPENRADSDIPSVMPSPLRVLIADDHGIVRRGLRQILADAFPSAQFGEAGNFAETMHLLKQEPWTLLVLDINMPDRSGLDVLKDIKQSGNRLPVLVLSVHSEDQYALRALKAGAAGYICKETAPELFVTAVQRILAGRAYISPTLAERLAADYRGSREKSAIEKLSDREMQVLQLIGTGKTVKEISVQLGLSVKTISTYRVRLLAKLEMRTNAEAMRFALDEGLVE